MNLQQLTTSEAQLMQLLWKLETFYLRNVLDEHPEPKPHQNTVSTYLKILLEKGFLSKVTEGRIFKYSTAVSEEAYRNFLLEDLVKQYFPEGGQQILKFLFEHNYLSQQDMLDYFDLKIEVKEKEKESEPDYKIADSILKEDKKKKKKKKDKKKKKKKKE